MFLAYLARHPKLEARRGQGARGEEGVGKVDLISKYVDNKKCDSKGTLEYIYI